MASMKRSFASTAVQMLGKCLTRLLTFCLWLLSSIVLFILFRSYFLCSRRPLAWNTCTWPDPIDRQDAGDSNRRPLWRFDVVGSRRNRWMVSKSQRSWLPVWTQSGWRVQSAQWTVPHCQSASASSGRISGIVLKQEYSDCMVST